MGGAAAAAAAASPSGCGGAPQIRCGRSHSRRDVAGATPGQVARWVASDPQLCAGEAALLTGDGRQHVQTPAMVGCGCPLPQSQRVMPASHFLPQHAARTNLHAPSTLTPTPTPPSPAPPVPSCQWRTCRAPFLPIYPPTPPPQPHLVRLANGEPAGPPSSPPTHPAARQPT